jgi:hypothetical protein
VTDESRTPDRLPVGSVDPSRPGEPWWKYRPLLGSRAATVDDAFDSTPERESTKQAANEAQAEPERREVEIVQSRASSGVLAFFLGAALLATVAISTQLGATREGPLLVPAGGFLLAVAAAQRLTRVHPDEPWLGRILVLGTAAKLAASYARYFNLETNYNGLGDAADYDRYGRQYASAWLHGGVAPVLSDLRKTNFVRYFTGIVYYVFGSNLMTGTFVFALLALVGTYFWYRAAASSVPILDKKLFLIFLLFAPSIAFWPSIVGKEALMQLGLGTLAFAASMVLRRKLIRGLLVGAPGGWLVWVVRPHLLALIVIGAAVAYFAGSIGARGWGLLSRPLGIIVMALLVAFTVTQAAKFLGISSLSVSSIQNELDQTTAQTAQGGSQFSHGNNSLNPIYYPSDFATVFVRPFPFEAHGLQLFASLEGVVLAGLIVARRRSFRVSLARSREIPFLMFCWVLVILYAIAFASFANFGILVRERSLVLPALLALLAVDPALDRVRRQDDSEEPRQAAIGAN